MPCGRVAAAHIYLFFSWSPSNQLLFPPRDSFLHFRAEMCNAFGMVGMISGGRSASMFCLNSLCFCFWSAWYEMIRMVGWSGPSWISLLRPKFELFSFFLLLPGHVAMVRFALWMVEMLRREGGAISRTVLPELTLVWFCPPWWLPPHYHPPSLSRPTTSHQPCLSYHHLRFFAFTFIFTLPFFIFHFQFKFTFFNFLFHFCCCHFDLFNFDFHFHFCSCILLFCHFSHISKVGLSWLTHSLRNILWQKSTISAWNL